MINKDFYEKGYFIIDNFLDTSISKSILEDFKKQENWFRVD